jgi:hypothetical protein
MRIGVRNAGPDLAELHVLPTLWFRNRWSWEADVARPIIRATAETGNVDAIAEEELLGRWRFTAGADPAGKPPPLLFCENETNARYLYGVTAEQTSYPKGRHQRPRRSQCGDGKSCEAGYKNGLLVSPQSRCRRNGRAQASPNT